MAAIINNGEKWAHMRKSSVMTPYSVLSSVIFILLQAEKMADNFLSRAGFFAEIL